MPTTALLTTAFFGTILAGWTPTLRSQSAPPDSGLSRLIHDYIALYRGDSLGRWRMLFLPSFTVAFTNEDGSITERNLDQFVERQRLGFARSPDMHEVLENVTIQQRASLASVWAEFVFTASGESRRGTLVMLCLRDRGTWRIQSLLFSYHGGG